MKTTSTLPSTLHARPQQGFSLLELLVVIAIIAILAGMLMTGFGGAGRKKQVSAIKASMNEIVTAVEEYKARRGFYPPTLRDSSGNPILDKPTLYYELVGTRYDEKEKAYRTLDDQETILLSDVQKIWGTAGAISNSGKEAGESQNFYLTLKKDRRARTESSGSTYGVLALPIRSGNNENLVWHFNSYNPTNNPGRFDLWVEWVQPKTTEIIGNW